MTTDRLNVSLNGDHVIRQALFFANLPTGKYRIGDTPGVVVNTGTGIVYDIKKWMLRADNMDDNLLQYLYTASGYPTDREVSHVADATRTIREPLHAPVNPTTPPQEPLTFKWDGVILFVGALALGYFLLNKYKV